MTNDGRTLVATLHGFDQYQNCILTNAQERIYSKEEEPTVVDLGLYLLRGDNIALVGELDEVLDDAMDLKSQRADPIKPVVHTAF